MEKAKIVSIAVIALLFANVVVFAMKLISVLVFWFIIGLAALFAYKGLPKLRKSKY